MAERAGATYARRLVGPSLPGTSYLATRFTSTAKPLRRNSSWCDTFQPTRLADFFRSFVENFEQDVWQVASAEVAPAFELAFAADQVLALLSRVLIPLAPVVRRAADAHYMGLAQRLRASESIGSYHRRQLLARLTPHYEPTLSSY